MHSEANRPGISDEVGVVETYSILIIEDSDVDAMIVQTQLLRDGRFAVERAGSLREGIGRLHVGTLPDAITLDLSLSDSSGLVTFEKIHERFPNEPVVILTSEDEESLAVEAMRSGAQDYVQKSALSGPVLVRSLLYAIERNRRRLVQQRQRAVERELEFAKEIQQHLLPHASPDIAELDVAGRTAGAESTSGDFFDFIDHNDGKWDVVLADVCGHGIGPAMITVGTRRLLRSCAELYEDLGDLMTIANRGICEDTFQSLFITLFFVRLDPRQMRLEFVGAGHPAFLIDAEGAVNELETEGIPTGVDPEYRYRVDGSIELDAGEIVLLMTDGVWEASADQSQPFGKQRAFELVHRLRDRSAEEIASCLIDAVKAYCHPNPIQDDLTAVVIKSR